MILSESLLFNNRRLFEIFQAQLKSSQAYVDKISKETFINNTDEKIIESIFSEMAIIPLKIYRDKVERTGPCEIKLDKHGLFGERVEMPAVILEIILPFTGDKALWTCQPSQFTFNPPCGDVLSDRTSDLQGTLKIKFGYYQEDFIGDNVNKEIESILSDLDRYLAIIESDIEKHNKLLKQQIQQQVKARRVRINAIFNQAKAIQVPLKRREDAPDISSLSVTRRKVSVLSDHTSNSEKSYAISDQAYLEILSLIRHQCASYERTPQTYQVHDEEELRDILLAQLNGQFEGQATGETFRGEGKTDICIEANNRAAFVAECKVWQGEKAVLDAIDQLLGYLTWRDVKIALVIFNKKVAGFIGIQKKILEIIHSHPSFISVETTNGGTEWHVRLRSNDDEECFIEMHVFLINLYVKDKKGGNNE